MNKIIKIARQFAKDLGVELKHIQVAKIQDKIIFSSGDSLRIITAISKEQVLTQLKNKFKERPEQVEQILQADPHPDKAYSIWISKLLLSKNIILPEDASKILEKINLFNDLKKRNKITGVDINRLKTYQELASIVEEASGQKTKGEAYRENLESGQELVYQDGQFKVVKITSIEASSKLCRGTEWCVKDPEYSEGYLEEGPLFLIYKNNSPYVLFHEPSGSAKDVRDASISEKTYKELAGIIENIGIKNLIEESQSFLAYVSDDFIMNNLEKFNEEALYRNLISLDDYIKINPNDEEEIVRKLMEVALQNKKRLSKEHEQYIINYADYIMDYIRGVVKGRWPEAEGIIAWSSSESYEYALKIIKGRFELGEDAISKNAKISYMYAKNVIKGRFPLGEKAIFKNKKYAEEYNELVGGLPK